MKQFLMITAMALGVCLSPILIKAADARPHTSNGIERSQNPAAKPTVSKKKKVVKSSKRKATKSSRRTVKKSTTRRAVASTTRAVVPVAAPKCQFLFWEVDCANFNNNNSNDLASNYEPLQKVASSSKNITKAQRYVGLHARTNRQTVKAIISTPHRPIDPVKIPWCAAFANAILRENNMATTDSLMARSFLNYGLVANKPIEGDIVVLKRGRGNVTGHVGFYVNSVTIDGRRYVAVLGGNQGRAINIAYYPANKVLGYRRPVAA